MLGSPHTLGLLRAHDATLAAAQMGKVNFGYILGWSVLSMLALNWLVNLLAGPAQARLAAPRFRTRAL